MDGCVVKKGLDGFIVVFGPWSSDILVIIRYSKCARLSNHVEKKSIPRGGAYKRANPNRWTLLDRKCKKSS